MTTNKPEGERAVVELLNGVSRIIVIGIHPDPYSVYPIVELEYGERAEFYKTSRLNVCYYREVENDKDSRRGLFR